jgi:hypothetical protein
MDLKQNPVKIIELIKLISHFLGKYNDELEASSSIPKTFKDFLDVSDYVKNRYEEIRNKNKIIDCLLCLTGMITIVLSLQEVRIKIKIKNFTNNKILILFYF